MSNKHVIVGAFFLSIVFSLAGCDKLSTLTSYFDSKFKKTSTAPTTPQEEPLVTPQAAVTEQTPAPKSPMAADVLARVGNWTLTLSDFKERLKALKEAVPEYDPKNLDQNKQILQELIRQQLLVKYAEETGVGNKKEIQQAVEEFRRTLLVREVAVGLTEGVKATEEEAKKYYEENKGDFVEAGKWHVREIAVETEQEAKDILVELYKGADFIEQVKAKSKSKSAWQKGDLGMLTTFPFPKMEKVAQALEVGGVSGVFEGPEGFYIIKLEEKVGGEAKAFDAIKADIISGLTMLKQQQIILNKLDELQKKTEVEVNEKLLEE